MSAGAFVKRLFVGRPISSHQELHHRLSKRIALAVFSSDALSSSAYASDEILLVLVAAGSLAIGYSSPIALAVTLVLAVVVTSYRQTVAAYPSGGGAYIVAHDNLGEYPGLTAASALLIDYVLTVSVSVAAGVAAIGAAFPIVAEHRVALALAVVLIITVANLRGLKESGTIFAVPTYGFLLSMGLMILVGVFKVATGNDDRLPVSQFPAEHPLTVFLILRAFASGSTALTGVEAISNGVPAFKPPESKHASQTLLVMGLLLGLLFFGITFLAHQYRVDPLAIEEGRTVTSQVAGAVFGAASPLFYAVQFFTAFILFLAANTSYADFPRLASILARDRYLPSVFKHRGDKLAFSNGIVILALAAGAVLSHYEAEVHNIIPLYVIGVFTSFTLSQSGMVIRWFRRRARGWRRSALINGVGAATTFVVLIIVSVTKFTLGAWQVIILIPTVALLLRRVRRHYDSVAEDLSVGRATRVAANKVVVLVSPYRGATLKAVSFARAIAPRELHVVAFRVPERRLKEIRRRWRELGVLIPIEATGHRLDDVLDFVRDLDPSESEPVMVVTADVQDPSRLRQLRRTRLLLRIKRRLLYEPGVVTASVPFRPDREHESDRLRAPGRLSIIVLVSAMHAATIRALELARSLNPSELKALTIATDSGEAEELVRQWESRGIDVPLEVVDSPYRSLMQPLLREVRELGPNPSDAVGVVIPEFVVTRWWQQLLHNQSAFMIKMALLFEPNVVVIDVPSLIRGRKKGQRPTGRAQL
ncbi:MAG: APC family permease [Actinomycetota bacterium]